MNNKKIQLLEELDKVVDKEEKSKLEKQLSDIIIKLAKIIQVKRRHFMPPKYNLNHIILFNSKNHPEYSAEHFGTSDNNDFHSGFLPFHQNLQRLKPARIKTAAIINMAIV